MRGFRLFMVLLISSQASLMSLRAQEPTDDYLPYNEIGINVTTLIGQIIPFNRTGTRIGPYSLHVIKMSKNNRGIRFSLGADIDSDDEVPINILLGFERRKSISPKFTYRRGTGAYLSNEGINSPFSDRSSSDLFIGLAVTRGLEYHPFKDVSISTEAVLFLGAGEFGPQIVVLPPLAINLNVKF